MKWTVLICMATLAISASSAGAAVRGCNFPYGYGPSNDAGVPIGNVSARNMTCSAALTRISEGVLLRDGNLRTRGSPVTCFRRTTLAASKLAPPFAARAVIRRSGSPGQPEASSRMI